jgi:hypothetical protein
MDRFEQTAEEAMNQAESAQTHEWPALISLDAPDLPRLTGNELPGWAGAFAVALAKSTETPLELTVAMVLATCATATARRYKVRIREGYYEPMNLWLAAALPPGNRKSSVQSAAAAPLLSWERTVAKDMEPEIKRITSEVKTIQARVAALRKNAANSKSVIEGEKMGKEAAELEAATPEIPRPPQLWTSDATPERLGTILGDNGECMAWLSSEGGVFDLLSGRYSGGIPNLDLVLKAHSGDAERVDRGSRPPVFLRHPLLTIGLSPQPDVLRGLATKPGFRGRGLLGRFLYFLPPSPLGYRTLENHGIPQPVEANYHAGVYAILDKPSLLNDAGEATLRVIQLSPEAYAEWFAFAKHVESSMRPNASFEHATDWAGKAPGAAARLAGVMHVIEHANGVPEQTPISLLTMQRALNLMAVISQHSLYALDLMGADPTIAAARHVWRWVESGRRKAFTVREAYQALKGSFPRVKELEAALDVLAERGYIEIAPTVKTLTGRPPSPTVTVRPDIAQGWAL